MCIYTPRWYWHIWVFEHRLAWIISGFCWVFFVVKCSESIWILILAQVSCRNPYPNYLLSTAKSGFLVFLGGYHPENSLIARVRSLASFGCGKTAERSLATSSKWCLFFNHSFMFLCLSLTVKKRKEGSEKGGGRIRPKLLRIQSCSHPVIHLESPRLRPTTPRRRGLPAQHRVSCYWSWSDHDQTHHSFYFKCTKPVEIGETTVVQIDYWIEHGRNTHISCKIACIPVSCDHALDTMEYVAGNIWELWEASATGSGGPRFVFSARTKSSRVRFDMPEDASFCVQVDDVNLLFEITQADLMISLIPQLLFSCFFWMNPGKSMEGLLNWHCFVVVLFEVHLYFKSIYLTSILACQDLRPILPSSSAVRKPW